MAKKYEDFDEGESDGVFDQILNIITNRKREFAIVSVSAAVILLGLVVWGSYPKDEDAASESVPIVRADATDYKTAPDNPGGMEIPYRDSTVFSSADGQQTEGTENILADESAEEPMSKEQAFAGLNTDGSAPAPVAEQPQGEQPAEVAGASSMDLMPIEPIAKAEPVEAPSNDALVKEAIGTTTAAVADTATPQVAATVEIAAATIPAAVKEIPKEEPAPEAKAVAKIESAAGTAATKAISPGNYYVQLASVKSTAGADGEYKKLQVKYSALSGVKYRTQEANLGPKGLFYRIQAGPMSKDSATSICNGIKAKGGSCLVAGK